MNLIYTLLFMAAGFLLGWRGLPQRLSGINQRLCTICTALLIFSMGVTAGARPDFFASLLRYGPDSILLALLPSVFSVALAYIFTLRRTEGGRHGLSRRR